MASSLESFGHFAGGSLDPVLLGIIGIFPLYYGSALLLSPREEWFTSGQLTDALSLALLVGSPLGLFSYLRDNPRGPRWIDVLRYPTPVTAVKLSSASLIVAGLSYFGVSRWTGTWPSALVILVVFLLFVLPIGLALLVTIRALRARER